MDLTAPVKAQAGRGGRAWEIAARAGFAATGLIHLILSFVIVRIGVGDGGEADESRLIASLADEPMGVVVVWVAVGAWGALGAWQAIMALRPRQAMTQRLAEAGRAAVYAGLSVAAATIVIDGSSGQDSEARGFAGVLMSAPAGRALVAAAGVGAVAAAVVFAGRGVTQKFTKTLKNPPTAVRWLGAAGYPGRAVALGLVGALFIYAGVTAEPDKAQGLDGALERILSAPAGPALVVAVGVGFAAYGAYSLARARFARM